MSEKQIVEINGIKMEIDMRHAKVIENYKVGDNVKVLIKNYSGYESFPGVIIGFDDFHKLPTINVCYIQVSYSSAEVKFVSLNSETKDIEIVHMAPHEKVLDKSRALDYLNNCIKEAEAKTDDLKRKRNYFLEKYNENLLSLDIKQDSNLIEG
jgi:hypothetical protein